jgi:hypothetical protein
MSKTTRKLFELTEQLIRALDAESGPPMEGMDAEEKA